MANLEEVHIELKCLITKAQECYQKSADNRHVPAPPIKVGDHVFILAKFIQTTRPLKKLSEKYLGPFEVTSKPGMHSYLVNLPDHLRSIHPMFYVSQLEPALTSQIPNHINLPPPIEIDRNLKFEIAQVLDSKLDKWKKNLLLYYVCWTGYKSITEEYSWLAASDLENTNQLVANFYFRYPKKLGPSLLT